MGILTVMCYEQARLFEYFSAPVSQAGCSFVKALYCISFLCQSPFPVAVPCQTMTPGFLQVAWRRACHEPRGLTASHWTTLETPLCPSVCLLSSHSGSHFSFFPPFYFFFTLTSFTPLPSTSFSPSFNILFATSWLSFSSLCPHLLSSLHPFFPPPFVPLSRSEEGLSGVSWASHRSRPHLAKGISETAVSNKRTWTHTRGATVHT